MAALPTEALAGVDRPRAPRVDPARSRKPLPVLLAYLSARGHWPALEALHLAGNRWDSPTIWEYIEAHVPIERCPMCGEGFFLTNRRVSYCGDPCRRLAAATQRTGPYRTGACR